MDRHRFPSSRSGRIPRAISSLAAVAWLALAGMPARACIAGSGGALDCALGLSFAEVTDRPTADRDGWRAGGVLDESASPGLLDRVDAGGVSVAIGTGALGGVFAATDVIDFAASDCARSGAGGARLRCANASGRLVLSPDGTPSLRKVGVSARRRSFALPALSGLPLAVTLTADDGAVHGDTAFPCKAGPTAAKISCRNTDPDTTTTAGILCDHSRSVFNPTPSVNATATSSWTCDGSSRVLAGNGLPDHAVGTFPNPDCPNRIGATTVAATYTLTPEIVNPSGTIVGPPGIGHALNGVKLDPGTGGTCDDSGSNCTLNGVVGGWHIEALGQSSFDFGTDENNAHVQPDGSYHYHGMPEGLVDSLGKGQAMTLVAWARDGFPIYARRGHADADDASSAIVAMRGSWQLKAAPAAGRPSTSLYAMGTFNQDWEYVAGSGDLDECNGRFGVTPEFPLGIYHYYVTDTYPFIQRCVKGTPAAMTGGGPPPPPPPPPGA
ncbi:MAG: YHYH protein [Alphaproteobacteria bacterium]